MYSSAAAGFYPHSIDQSLRFEDGDSPRLTRTPSSAGNRKTWTWSAWVKRGNISAGQFLFQAYDGASSRRSGIKFNSDNTIAFDQGGGASSGLIDTVAVYRDVSSFYHIVVVADYSNGTAGNRAKIYVNGVLQTVTTSDDFENADGLINSTNEHSVSFTSSSFFDGYMSEVNFIDGTALGPDSFGETKDGIWVPKDVSGLTYGTNGFHLDFADSSAIGNDVSGQNNDFAVSGLVASDVVLDSPTNNFAVMNVIDQELDATTKEGNLFVTTSDAGRGKIRSTFTIPKTGKWYWETYLNSSTNDAEIGVAPQSLALKNTDQLRIGADNYTYRFATGEKGNNSIKTAYGDSLASGDVASVLFDADAGAIYFYKNGTIQNSGTAAFTSIDTSLDYCPAMGDTSTASGVGTVKIQWNFGQDSTFAGRISAGGNSDSAGIGDFKYSVPSGAKSLCSANLPEPSIIDASDYFNTVIYTGDNSQDVTGVGFSPDLVWVKTRDHTYNHQLHDSVRGATAGALFPNDNTDETSFQFDSFDADGFTTDASNVTGINATGDTQVAWNWLAGTAVSGATTGSGTAKTYTGSVNTEAGFSIIKYVGNGTSGHTIPHNLTVDGVATTPTMIIVKRLDADGGWRVQHKDVPATHYLALDTNAGKADLNTIFNDTAFNSTVFTVGNAASINSNDKDYIAYCFTDIDQYCKAGMYFGNSSANGTYVNTGFKVSWLMVKDRDSTGSWYIWDDKRSPHNEMNDRLVADLTAAETADREVDFLSNGFKLRESNNAHNTSGREYIYLAFGSSPAKYSNAK